MLYLQAGPYSERFSLYDRKPSSIFEKLLKTPGCISIDSPLCSKFKVCANPSSQSCNFCELVLKRQGDYKKKRGPVERRPDKKTCGRNLWQGGWLAEPRYSKLHVIDILA